MSARQQQVMELESTRASRAWSRGLEGCASRFVGCRQSIDKFFCTPTAFSNISATEHIYIFTKKRLFLQYFYFQSLGDQDKLYIFLFFDSSPSHRHSLSLTVTVGTFNRIAVPKSSLALRLFLS